MFGGTGPQGVTSATEGAYWQNTYDPEAEWGPMFHDVRHNFIFSATYELPCGKGRRWGSDWGGDETRSSAAGRSAASSRRAPACPSPSSTAATARCRASAARSGRTASATGSPPTRRIDHWLDINAFEAAALGTFGNCPTGVARAPGYSNVDLVLSKRFPSAAARATSSSGWRRSTPSTTRASGRRRATSRPEHVRDITNTISAPRVVELVLKLYF